MIKFIPISWEGVELGGRKWIQPNPVRPEIILFIYKVNVFSYTYIKC